MPILLSAAASPFGRKAKIALALCDLSEVVEIRHADTNDPADPLSTHNPLGKIPVLILDDGTAVYDSAVIAEWADGEAGSGRIIPPGPKRIDVLTTHALADGIMEASLSVVYEKRYRPEHKWVDSWIERQEEKTARGLAHLEAAPPPLGDVPDIGAIATACALGYRDFRFGPQWRRSRPALARWLTEFQRLVPAYGETDPAVA